MQATVHDPVPVSVVVAVAGLALLGSASAWSNEVACSPPAVAALQAKLLSSPDERSRLMALATLQTSCSHPHSMPVLCGALRAGVEPWRVRISLIAAIAPPVPLPPFHSCVVPALAEVVARDVPAVRVMAAEALLRLDPLRPGQLVEPLAFVVAQRRWLDASPVPDPMGGTVNALRLLVRLGPLAAPAESALISALEAHDSEARLLACRALASLGPAATAAVPALTRARSDPYYDVAAEAAAALRIIVGSESP
jgi:HEAT repeat protein